MFSTASGMIKEEEEKRQKKANALHGGDDCYYH
uniref:Uncharacterized protein n=1 Tax=Anguilla anguilla TaxID=7936 RepID=A0A0E9UW76_ANGAN